jgi:hypothetical protein
MVLADVGNGDVLLWIFEVFLFVIWFWVLITIFSDLIRDHEISGWTKALWFLFVLVVPFLGILCYLIFRGGGMAGRAQKQMQEAQAQFDAYVQQTAGSGSPTDQIAKAKELLDSGAIDQAEFDRLKAKALA